MSEVNNAPAAPVAGPDAKLAAALAMPSPSVADIPLPEYTPPAIAVPEVPEEKGLWANFQAGVAEAKAKRAAKVKTKADAKAARIAARAPRGFLATLMIGFIKGLVQGILVVAIVGAVFKLVEFLMAAREATE